MLTIKVFIFVFAIAVLCYKMGVENGRYKVEHELRLKEINEIKERLG